MALEEADYYSCVIPPFIRLISAGKRMSIEKLITKDKH